MFAKVMGVGTATFVLYYYLLKQNYLIYNSICLKF